MNAQLDSILNGDKLCRPTLAPRDEYAPPPWSAAKSFAN